jgi:hypothetical protein
MRLRVPLIAALVLSGCRALIGIQDPPRVDDGGPSETSDGGDAGTTGCVADGNLIRDPGFECQSSITLSPEPFWYVQFQGVLDADVDGPNPTSIETNPLTAHGGRKDAFIVGPTGGTYLWTAVAQDVSLLPNTTYKLTAYIETSHAFGMDTIYVGVQQGPLPPIVDDTPFGSTNMYRQVTVGPFDSGEGGMFTVFAGYWSPPPSSWMRVDDVSLVAE